MFMGNTHGKVEKKTPQFSSYKTFESDYSRREMKFVSNIQRRMEILPNMLWVWTFSHSLSPHTILHSGCQPWPRCFTSILGDHIFPRPAETQCLLWLNSPKLCTSKTKSILGLWVLYHLGKLCVAGNLNHKNAFKSFLW